VSEPDAELVRRAAQGDASAFAILVDRHERRVYNLGLRMLGDPDDASDVVQDTFLAAFRRLSTFRGEAAFTTWLHRIAVNACYDALRARGRGPLLGSDHDAGEDASERTAPLADHADDAAGALDVRRALLAVQPEYRAALVLHDVLDMAVDEVARVLGVPVGTVKSRLHRGRVSLGRAMGVREPGGRGNPSNG
jgi:RNA polymerase sigma-70 factor (ECF subfamily)